MEKNGKKWGMFNRKFRSQQVKEEKGSLVYCSF